MSDLSDAMFEPFTDDKLQAAGRAAPVDRNDKPEPIIPVPVDASSPDCSSLRPTEATDDPVATWTYLTADGVDAFHVVRWENVDPHGRKVIRPLTWCQFPNGSKGWALKAMSAPKPLYNLPAILESPQTLVVVVEGEKCADAAVDAFPDAVVTTWQGGSDAWRSTDWEPLAERDVLLLADTDHSGREAMCQIAERLASMGCTVRVHRKRRSGPIPRSELTTRVFSERRER